MTVYVGIDWGKAESVYAFGADQKGFKTRKVSNGVEGLKSICSELVKLAGEPERVTVVVEAGSSALVAWLIHARFSVHVVDGKRARRFVQSLSSSDAKTDKLDARCAWQMAQSPMHLDAPASLVDGGDRAMAVAIRARDQLSKQMTRCTNQLRALLTELVPDLEVRFKTMTAQYVRDLIRLVPTPWHAAELNQGDWQQFLDSHRVPRRKVAKLWEAIQATALRPGFDEDSSRHLGDAVAICIDELDDQLRRDRKFEAVLAGLVDTSAEATVMQTLNGVGLKISSRLASTAFSAEHRARAERSADSRDYPTRLARCAPVRIQTGVTIDRVKRRRAGNNVAASATMHAAVQASQCLPWAKAMMKYRRDRGDGYYTALRKIGRSLLRILGAMIRTGQAYDDARYVAGLKAKGVTWAANI